MGLTASEQSLRDDAHAWFDAHREEFIAYLQDWVRIPSVSRADLAEPEAPYGPDISRMFDAVAMTAASLDFELSNHDGHAISIRHGSTDREIGLISHLDVVPAGEGWSYPPFEPTIRDGYMIGRGVRDNKGAALLDLFLLRFFRDRGWPLQCGVRVIYGGAEETGMADLQHYVATARVPDVSLVTDGFFPVNNIQHGRVSAHVRIPVSRSVGTWNAGDADNSVPALAQAYLEDPQLIAALLAAGPMPAGIEVVRSEASLLLNATGVAGHSAFPGLTVNAAGVLAAAIGDAAVLRGDDARAVDFLSRLLGDPHGVGVGLDVTDDSGRLTLNVGRLRTVDGAFEVSLTMRVPVEHEASVIVEKLARQVRALGGDVWGVEVVPAHVVPADDPIVRLLLDVFDDATGATTTPIAIGGGTHARVVPRAHTFGPGLYTEQAIDFAPRRQAPFLPPGHGDPHGPDECVSIDNLRMAFGLYALTLMRLDRVTA